MTDLSSDLASLRIDRTARGQERSSLWRWLVVGGLLLAIGGAGWWWMTRAVPLAVTMTAVEVRGAGGASGDEAVLNASGYVTARRRATVSSRVTGKVTAVYVDEGMSVSRGQVLARLDDSTAQAALALSEAELASVRTRLIETEVRIREAEVALGRQQSLATERLVATADVDAATAQVDALRARLEAARQDVLVAERQVGVRRTDLDDTVIRAPFSGKAVSKDAQPGEMVSPISAGGGFTRTGICTIVDMTSLEIEVDVNESYITRISDRQPVRAVLDAYPDWSMPAHVITTVPTADRQKATVLVLIGSDALDARLLPDMGVKVTFLKPEQAPAATAAAPRTLWVPATAVRRGSGSDGVVFVTGAGRATRRPVQLGRTSGDAVEVRSGLSAGDRVIVGAPAELTDGMLVAEATRP
ncbi:MAG: efflux RND transporter periplasmic adaptor subunit [Luteitalea sp.]